MWKEIKQWLYRRLHFHSWRYEYRLCHYKRAHMPSVITGTPEQRKTQKRRLENEEFSADVRHRVCNLCGKVERKNLSPSFNGQRPRGGYWIFVEYEND